MRRFTALLVFACIAAAAAAGRPADAAAVNAAIVSGNNQAVARSGTQAPGGSTLFAPLVVLITDAAGKPLANVPVTFTCAAPAAMVCVLTGALAKTATVNSDTLGHATLNQYGGSSVSTYFADGALTINVTGNTFAPVAFTLRSGAPGSIATPAPIANSGKLTIVSGNNQTLALTASGAAFQPLDVLLTDSNGNPIPNAYVYFTCADPAVAGICEFGTNGTPWKVTLTTNAQGHAIAGGTGTGVNVANAPGPFSVTAAYGTSSVAFQLTATGTISAKAATELAPTLISTYTILKIVSGNNQIQTRSTADGLAHFAPLSVSLNTTLPSYVPVAGVNLPIAFSCKDANGRPCPLTPAGLSAINVPATGPNNIATLSSVTASADGPIAVTASFPTTGASATFLLTALSRSGASAPGAGTAVAKVTTGGNQATLKGKDVVFSEIGIQLLSPDQLPFIGVQISWSCSTPAGTACHIGAPALSTFTSKTDTRGIASIPGARVVGAPANVVITASSPVMPAPFTITLHTTP